MSITKSEKDFKIYIIAILMLSLSQSFMHNNFLVHPESKIVNYKRQLQIAHGMYDDPAKQSRLLFPKIVSVTGFIVPSDIFSEDNHAELSLILAEWIVIFFGLLGLFLLGNDILKSKMMSFLIIITYSLYLPYIFQISTRYGETLIFGFFSFLAYAVLSKKQILFIILVLLCSAQRPGIAFTGVLFKVIYEYSFDNKKYRRLFVNILFFIIPIAITSLISMVYNLNAYNFWLEHTVKHINNNTKYMPVLLLSYCPVFVLTAFNFRKFDKKIYYLIACLIPYLSMVFFLGSFAETRLLHPLIVVLIIGILSSVKGANIKTFIDNEFSQ